jgi:hypothetical protein
MNLRTINLRTILFLILLVAGAATFLFGFMNMVADPHPYDPALLVIGGILAALWSSRFSPSAGNVRFSSLVSCSGCVFRSACG